MAKCEVTYRCGHDGIIQLYGPHKDRDWKADREAEKLCPDCWRAEVEAKREAENAASAAKAKEAGLAELAGSPKQVAWAETIRAKAAEQLVPMRAGIVQRAEKAPPGVAETTLAIIDEVLGETAAKVWIDNRDRRYDLHWLGMEVKARLASAPK